MGKYKGKGKTGIDNAGQAEYFDAHEQQFIDLKTIDDKSLLWLQVLRVGQNSMMDPEEGGREQIIQVGGGAGAIIEKKYIPHPYARYVNMVLHLYDLLVCKLERLGPGGWQKTIVGTHGLLCLMDFKSPDAYHKARRLFRDLLRVMNKYHGDVEEIIDEINPELVQQLVAERKKKK